MAAKGRNKKSEKRFGRIADAVTLSRMNNAPPAPDSADHTAATAFLWRWVFRHLAWFVATFGGLTEMARIPIAHDAVMREARMRLRVLGALVRRLIVAMAAAMEIAPTRPPAAQTRHASTRKPRDTAPETEDPATWRVRFVIAPADALLVSCAGAGAGAGAAIPPQPFVHFNPFSLRPMARDLEAIRRVIADPQRHARRVARQLAHAIFFCGADTAFLRGADRDQKADIRLQMLESANLVNGALHDHAVRGREDSS